MSFTLPPHHAVAKLLGELIGRAVTARVVPPAKFEANARMVGTYDDEKQALRALVCCDLPASASLGAALVLIPVGAVDDAVKERSIDGTLAENLYEVLNVLAAVFPQHGAPRLIFRQLLPGTGLPADVEAILAAPGGRLDLEVDVAGYRRGRLSIFAA